MIKTKQSISFSAENSCFLYNIIHRLGCVIRGCGNEFCEIKVTCVMNLNEPMNVTQYCCIFGLTNGTLTTGVLNSMFVFFSVRLLSVLRGHSGFSSPPQRPMTSDFEGFSIPALIHYIYFANS